MASLSTAFIGHIIEELVNQYEAYSESVQIVYLCLESPENSKTNFEMHIERIAEEMNIIESILGLLVHEEIKQRNIIMSKKRCMEHRSIEQYECDCEHGKLFRIAVKNVHECCHLARMILVDNNIADSLLKGLDITLKTIGEQHVEMYIVSPGRDAVLSSFLDWTKFIARKAIQQRKKVRK